MATHHAHRILLLLGTALACSALPAHAQQPQPQPQPQPPAPVASAPGALPPNPAASAGGMSDAVARCEARISALERRQCRRQLAHQSPLIL